MMRNTQQEGINASTSPLSCFLAIALHLEPTTPSLLKHDDELSGYLAVYFLNLTSLE